jgi:ribosomal-protein-alanine N-acetyltransferase
MAEALEAGIQYMFLEKGLHRIQANVVPSNDRSIRLLERLGFKLEGRHEKYLKIQGRWQDHLSFARLNEDPAL